MGKSTGGLASVGMMRFSTLERRHILSFILQSILPNSFRNRLPRYTRSLEQRFIHSPASLLDAFSGR